MDNTKFFSEMERYEIININDGDKYSFLGNNDVAIDEHGNLKLLLLNDSKSSFSLFSKSDFFEVPWECVKKIGSRTIIIDMEREENK
ncbi:YlmC/YmxH family sporulation protein [Hathewaya massiliensis]|uniref:YlmC/YmxH family sporulation protein n=1 Tax=Hathewaya massiliensis TaxID=1964382 RepID=UPI001159D38E|nr:YlmC/YmxH family sporulation protein [Hathewaya massiliensis]